MTLPTDQLLNGLPPDLTLRFFAMFARLEYALKYCRYLQVEVEGAPALASWKALAAKLSNHFFEDANSVVSDIIKLLPKNLVVRQHGPRFEEQPLPLTETVQVIEAIWRVRNNLFHGNKTSPANRARDQRLMEDVLTLLDLILNERQEIRGAFYEPQQFA